MEKVSIRRIEVRHNDRSIVIEYGEPREMSEYEARALMERLLDQLKDDEARDAAIRKPDWWNPYRIDTSSTSSVPIKKFVPSKEFTPISVWATNGNHPDAVLISPSVVKSWDTQEENAAWDDL